MGHAGMNKGKGTTNGVGVFVRQSDLDGRSPRPSVSIIVCALPNCSASFR